MQIKFPLSKLIFLITNNTEVGLQVKGIAVELELELVYMTNLKQLGHFPMNRLTEDDLEDR